MKNSDKHLIDGIFKESMAQIPEEKPSVSGWDSLKIKMKKEGIKIEEEKKTNRFFWLSFFSGIILSTGALAYYVVNNFHKKSNIEKPLKEFIGNKENVKKRKKEDNSKTKVELTEDKKTPPFDESSTNKVEEKEKRKIGASSFLSKYSLRIATFSGQVNDPDLNKIPNLRSEYFPKEDFTIFYSGGYKNIEEAILGMEKIKKIFNSKIDPNDSASQKNLNDAYILFEEELRKLGN